MNRKILVSLICLIAFLMIGQQSSYAAIEIIPNTNTSGSDAIVNTTVSNSFLLCRQLTEAGNTLCGTTVVPHLATNKDWGAVAYLSNSVYGTNTEGGATGMTVTINGVDHYSTTPNLTGVMNFGSNPNKTGLRTQTSGLTSAYDNTTSTAATYVEELYKNVGTRFVDSFGTTKDTHIGMATLETGGLYGSAWRVGTLNDWPISIRQGLFSYWCANDSGAQPRSTLGISGAAHNYATFRPAIWNK